MTGRVAALLASCCVATGERERLLRVCLTAKGQHQARWWSMRVCSADHQDSREARLNGRTGFFQARAYCDTVNPSMADYLDAVETNSERAILLSSLGDVAVENPRKMCGPLMLLLKRVERGNGFEAWRLLVERYEGANASRLHHMLQSIMRPKTFPQDSGGFEVALNEWKHLVQRWEVLANDILNDAVKRQILLTVEKGSETLAPHR